jgi:hypothetical protein
MPLAFTVTVVSLLLGAASGLLFGRDMIRKSYWIWIAVGVFLAGLVLTVLGSELVAAGWQRRNWPSTSGTIIVSKIEGERAYHPEVVYSYTVAGQTYRDSTILHQPAFGNRVKRYDVASKEAALYAPGETIPVYYDPRAPQNSDLVTSVFWAEYEKTGLGAVLIGIASCLAVMLLRRRRLPSAPEDSRVAQSAP